MIARAALCSIVLMLWTADASAQHPNIRVSNPASTNPEEVTIAINPANPQNLAAGANIDYYYYSTDGGETWTQGQLSSTMGVWGDPSVTFDASGNLYFGHLSWPSSPGYWLDRIVVQKSVDGGMSWNNGVGVGENPPKQQDKEWLAADITGSIYHNNLYMAWTEFDVLGSSNPADSTRILFSRSTDAGAHWATPVRVSDVGGLCLDDDETVEGAVPAVGPNGEVYLAWAGHSLIYFDKSTDGGVTWGNDVVITTQPGGWDFAISGIYRCNGMPITACDISGSPYNGHVYVGWSDQRNGVGDTDVFLMKSTDGGATWGGFVRVNDDAPGSQQFFPWMCVDPLTGYVYFVFYDRRSTIGDATDVYVAQSSDGGATFTNYEVSDNSFIPDSGVFFGDYINIAALGGKVYPIWMRMDGTALSVWTAIIHVPTAVDDTAPIASVELMQNYPNPFNPATTVAFTLPTPGRATVTVHDAAGHLVASIADGVYPAGPTRIEWDGTDAGGRAVASGVYFCRLRAGETTRTRKMVLVR